MICGYVNLFLWHIVFSQLVVSQTGVTYLAQVLKRNRTLKLLNLSENKLDVQCLVVIAEALVRSLPL